MATIRLTQATWCDREYEKVKAVLTHQLDRTGIDESILARQLKRWLGVEYTGPELVAFRTALVADGIIEVDP
jgi:hypothetical protein